MHPTSASLRKLRPIIRTMMRCCMRCARVVPDEIHHGSTQVPSAASWTGQAPANRAHKSATGITCAVEAARVTSVACCTSPFGIGPKPQSG
jgi:hypothetical protein